jgi:hypothetical protein
MLQIAAASLAENHQVENGTPLIAPVDQTAIRSTTNLIPSVEFAYRALNGTLNEKDVADLTTPTKTGTLMQVESWVAELPKGKMQMTLRSSLVSTSDSGHESIDIMNSAVAILSPIANNYAAVQGFESEGRIADLYRLESIELTSY